MRNTILFILGFTFVYSIVFFLAGIKNVGASIIIDAPIDDVWRVFYDFSEYPEWNPYIKKVSGEKGIGSRVKTEIKVDENRTRNIKPVIIKNMKHIGFEWKNTTGFPGLKNEIHSFDFYPISNGRTIMNQYKHLTGIIVPFLKTAPEKEMIEMMNSALKERTEGPE